MRFRHVFACEIICKNVFKTIFYKLKQKQKYLGGDFVTLDLEAHARFVDVERKRLTVDGKVLHQLGELARGHLNLDGVGLLRDAEVLVFELQKLDGELGVAIEILVVALENANVRVVLNDHLDGVFVRQSLQNLLDDLHLETC